MAITGTFGADFSAFVSEVAKAETALDALKENANGAQAALTEVGGVSLEGVAADADAAAAAFAGVKDAIDPAALNSWVAAHQELAAEGAKAAEAEQGVAAESLNLGQVLGQLAGAFGITFSIGAVVNFGKAIASTAGEVQRMADQTGLTTDQVQGLMAAAAQTSSPIGAFTTAITALSEKIGSNDAGLIGATSQLGLSWAAIKTMTPYERFETYANALRDLTDKNQEAALGVDVFTKSWREMAPAINAGVTEIADAATKMTPEAIAWWDHLASGIVAAGLAAKNIVGEGVFRGVTTDLASGDSTLSAYTLSMQAAAEMMPKVAAPARDLPAPIRAITSSMVDLKGETLGMAADLAESQRAIAAERSALEAWQRATADLNAVGGSWWDTLRGIDGEVVEAIKFYTDAGVSQSTLATAYGLTATQVGAVVSAYKAEKEAAEASAKASEDVTRMLSQQIVQRALLTQKTLEADVTSKAHYEKLAADAAKAYADATASADQYTEAGLERLRVEKENAAANLANWRDVADKALTDVKGTADGTRAAVKAVNDEIETLAEQLARMRGGSWGAPGGDVSAGQGRAFSAVTVPAEMVGRWGVSGAGGILGAIGSQGYGVVNVQAGAVTMNYPIMDDPIARDAIGRVVGDSILERVTRGGARV